jgi:uncharacterized protein (DUF58 family)
VLSARGGGSIGAAAALWVAARSFGVPELQMAAVAALALVAIAGLYVALASTALEADRVVRPARLFTGEAATVVLTITNRGRVPTVPIDLVDRIPLVLADDSRASLPSLAPGDRATVRIALRAQQRGRFTLGPVSAVIEDPFGIARRTVALGAEGAISVYPAVTELASGIPLGGASGAGPRGGRRLHAQGEELAMVREYVRGDDLRGVHWPSTAHRGKLMVRHTESSQVPRAVIVMDVRAGRHVGHGPTASIEATVAAAASITAHLAARGHAAVLLDRPVAAPPVAAGWEAHLETLADVTPEDVDLGALLGQIGQGIAGDGTLFAVITLPDAVELRALVRAGRGFSTRVAVLVDAASHQGRADASAPATAAALRAAGWRVTLLRRGDRLDARWRELVSQRRVRAEVAR